MTSSPRETLLTIPNHHVKTDGGNNHPPAFDEAKDFVAYSANVHGEQLVFVQRDGDSVATLYHGDYAWEPVSVRQGIPVGFNADAAELLFVVSCWMQSRAFRPDSDKETNLPIVDALQAMGQTIQQLTLLASAASASDS